MGGPGARSQWKSFRFLDGIHQEFSNFNYQWTKSLYQNNLNDIAFLFTFFKG